MATTNDTANSNENDRNRAAGAYAAARERTSSAFQSTRETVSGAGQRAGDAIGSNPVGAVIGGFALGAIVAAVLPRTERESRALGGVGHKLADTAREAVQSATQAGKEQVEQIRETAVTQVGQAVVVAVTGAATGSSSGSGNGTGNS